MHIKFITHATLRPPLLASLLLTGLMSLSACTAVKPKTVKPWEKNLLAKPSMALQDSEIDAALDEHIYFSKEASLGGQGVGGGGCGCN